MTPDRPLDTGSPELLAHRDGRVLVLTLNRPGSRNAMSEGMMAALGRQLDAARGDAAIGCVLLTGAGDAFCAGGDVKAMAAGPDLTDAEGAIERQRGAQHATVEALFSMPKPTIAAINGPVAGAGLGLALACDLRTMARRAFVTSAFARVGLPGDFGVAFLATQLIGTARARELLYLSEPLSADGALAMGLTNRVFDDDAHKEESIVLARRIADGPAGALAGMKANLNRALIAPLEVCMDEEVPRHFRAMASEDHREGAAAFSEKRRPVFNRP